MCILLVYWRLDLCNNALSDSRKLWNLRIDVGSYILLLIDTRPYICRMAMTCVKVAIVPWKSDKYYTFCLCVCVLASIIRHISRFVCHLCPVPLYYIFPHYLTIGKIFEKKSFNIKCLLIFPKPFVWNISNSQKQSRNM